MTEIIEIPIVDEEAVEVSEAPAEEVVVPKPKARGRPKGALNKPKAPPKPKRAPRATAPLPESEDDEPEPPEPPQPPPRARRTRARAASPDSVEMEPPTTQDIAAQVIHMLTNRRTDQSAARREKYRGWCGQ
jgi:hypothetical protein